MGLEIHNLEDSHILNCKKYTEVKGFIPQAFPQAKLVILKIILNNLPELVFTQV